METLRLLRDMIAIPSVNPMRANSGEAVERGMADYLENVLRRAKIDCERQTIVAGRENIIGIVHPTRKPRNSASGLMFNSHMDTVPVENMSIDPFDPVIKGERLFGRGSCDAKASIAAMLSAVLAHAEKSDRPAPVVFAAMADEEFSFLGAWKLIEQTWPVSACVIGEPTRLNRVIAHKGVVRWRLRVTGISAHGATPELGRSAIYDGARVALALEEYARILGTGPQHPLLGRATINVGRVHGGQSVNIVPDVCEFEIERRLLPREDGRRAVADCENFVRAQLGENVTLTTEEPYLVDPALDTPENAAIVKSLGKAQMAELKRESPIEGAHYGTDGSKLAQAGIETVVCGPGDIAQAHTRDEFIEVDQLDAALRVYQRLLSNWPSTL